MTHRESELNFLDVAVELGYLNEHQAKNLLQEQSLRRHLGIPEGIKVADLAVELALLTNGAVQAIYLELQTRSTAGKYVLKKTMFGGRESFQLRTFDTIRLALASLLIPVTILASLRSWELAGVAVHFWASLIAFFEVLRSLMVRIPRESLQLPLRMIPIGILVSLSIAARSVAEMRRLANLGNSQTQIEAQWQLTESALLICGVCFLVVLTRSQWRKYRIELLEARMCAMRRLGQLLTDATAAFAQKQKVDAKDLSKYTHLVLQRTAIAIELVNPWDKWLKLFAKWKHAIAEITVWYVVPSARGEFFQVIDHAAPRANEKIKTMLESLESNYQPRFHDVKWCQENEIILRHQHKSYEEFLETFKNLPHRNQHTSLAGRAYACRTALSSMDPESPRYFDASFANVVTDGIDPLVEDWLDVTAYAAAAVNPVENMNDDPHGVIVVWKSGVSKASISGETIAVLATATRVLAGIIESWRMHNANHNK